MAEIGIAQGHHQAEIEDQGEAPGEQARRRQTHVPRVIVFRRLAIGQAERFARGKADRLRLRFGVLAVHGQEKGLVAGGAIRHAARFGMIKIRRLFAVRTLRGARHST